MSRIRGLGNREPHRRILNDCSAGRAYVLRRLQSTHRREMHRPATPDPEYHGIDRRRLHALGNSALISWSSTTKRDTQRSFCSKEESRPMPTGTRKRLGRSNRASLRHILIPVRSRSRAARGRFRNCERAGGGRGAGRSLSRRPGDLARCETWTSMAAPCFWESSRYRDFAFKRITLDAVTPIGVVPNWQVTAITFSAVPEPSTLVLVAAVFCCLTPKLRTMSGS
jgi:hypothetical protein